MCHKNKKKTKHLFYEKSSSGANSGWFGGIWNKLSMKPKNQMILPDDKNPSIVWNPDKKQWVNTTSDGGEEETEPFQPPPMGMPPQQQPQHQQPPSMPTNVPSFNQQPAMPMAPVDAQQSNGGLPNMTGGDPNKVPNLQSNMFKMQRNRSE